MDRKPSPVRFPLYSDVSLLAERCRELLCETHQKAPQARRLPLPPGTQRCHPPLPRRHQCKPKALYLDQGPQQNHRRRQARAPSVRFDPLVSSLRLQIGCSTSPKFWSLELFPDVLEPLLRSNKTVVDMSCVTTDGELARPYVWLPYLILRCWIVAAEYFHAD